jgi:hypothetical protein
VIFDSTDVDFVFIASHFRHEVTGGQRPPLHKRAGEIQAS